MMFDIQPFELSSVALVFLKEVIIPLGMCYFTVFIPQAFLSAYYVSGILLVAEM